MDVMLSDNLRRLICRTGFVLLCVIPTFFCFKWSVLPVTTTQWSARLQQQFGIINEIARVSVASPQETEFHGLRLGADRFQSRLSVDQATLNYLNEGKTLHLQNATGSAAAFWKSLQRIVETISWSRKSDRPICIRIDTVTLVENESGNAESCVWRDLLIRLEDRGRRLTLTFDSDRRTEMYQDGETPYASVERSCDNSGAHWLVNATGYQLPAWTLRNLVPTCQIFNRDAVLADAWLAMDEKNGQWSGQISGRLFGVELQHLVFNRFGRLLTGTASINLDYVTIDNNRVQSLKGSIYSPSGLIGSRLLQACSKCLGMQIVEPFGTQGTEEAYSHLSFNFRIQDFKVFVTSSASDSVLQDANGGKVLIAQQDQPHSVASIIHLLAWAPEQMNSSTAALAERLAMPPINIDPDQKMEQAERPAVGDQPYFYR